MHSYITKLCYIIIIYCTYQSIYIPINIERNISIKFERIKICKIFGMI